MSHPEPILGLILYGTSACHLCEDASELLRLCVDQWPTHYTVEYRDIEGDDELLAAYATRIPVIREPASGAELGWPFDDAKLCGWLLDCRRTALLPR